MPATLTEPVAHLIAQLGPGAPRRIIGMAGTPGAGKSTLAARLADEVNARVGQGTMVALGMDGFHLSKAELRQMPDPDLAFARRGAPWTFAPAALRERLLRIRAGAGLAEVAWPGFQHDIGDPIEGAEAVPPSARLVLVEGLYLLLDDDDWRPVRELLDERWYLDTPLALAMERLAQRHMRAWGWTLEAAQGRIDANDRPNAELVERSRAHADWLVESR
jgi:pantothenate kinase